MGGKDSKARRFLERKAKEEAAKAAGVKPPSRQQVSAERQFAAAKAAAVMSTDGRPAPLERPRRVHGLVRQARIYWPDHPVREIVSPSGWVVERRAALAAKLRGVPTMRCVSCRRVVVWCRGPASWTNGGRTACVQVWHWDGDRLNVRPENLEPVCCSCLRRGVVTAPVGAPEEELTVWGRYRRRSRTAQPVEAPGVLRP